MSNIRVHELAKELNMSSKEVMAKLKTLGIEVKNHLSAIEQGDAERLRAMLKSQTDLGKGESPEKLQSSPPEIKAASQPGENQLQQSPPHPVEEQRRPRRPGEGGRRPRRPGEEGKGPRRPGEEKKRPVKVGEEGRRPRRPGEEGRRPPRPKPGEERRRPVRPGEEGKRQESPGVQMGEDRVARRIMEDRRQRSETEQVSRDQRATNSVIAGSVMDQPSKRANLDKKKAEERDKIYGRKREMEREFRELPKKPKPQDKEVKDTTPKHIQIPEVITVQELAQKMSRKAGEVIKKLMDLGVMATINQEIDADTATIVASEMGVTVEVKAEKPLTVIEDIEDDPADLKPRPPVVTVMGHVDHGKTSLLDAIRHSNVTATEAGGITQHIGAYQVDVNGQKITFLDTPGHEAFTAMRARGAQVTDIAILVVAADDGVMPQTVEAINHAKAADVPIVVAINKIDKPDANPERVKQELTEYGLVVEEWGGDTIAVPVSAKTGQNLDQLLEMVLLVAEMRELKANPNRPATGTVIEAQLDKRRGPVATVLVAKGTLEVGDVIVAGTSYGRIRAMMDDKGKRVKKAGPSVPVEILGLNEAPEAGERFYVVADEKLARQIAHARAAEKKVEESKKLARVSLDDLFDRIKEGEVKELNLIIKADVQGSVEALRDSLLKLSTPEVRVNSIHGGVGAITESDVMLAAASNAIIIGFNVRPDGNTKETAERQGVDIRLYRVIYDAIEDVKKAMSGLLEPEYKEVDLGRAEVRQVFRVPKVGVVAGCYVLSGKITRNAKVRVVRDGIVIYDGVLESLKRFKDDVREVPEAFECGMSIKDFQDIKEGDIIEAYVVEEVKREL